MAKLINVPVRGQRGIIPCPTCGFPVRVVRRNGNHADHYEPIMDERMEADLAPQDPETATKLRELRAGKRTVALVGMGPTSCSLAPYDDEDVEIWALNEMHAFPWMKRATRWFQIHPRRLFTRAVAVRNVRGHFDWLKEKHGIPIYMQFKHDDIPDSVEYPLHDILERFFKNIRKGDAKVKYLSESFAYMMALALHEDYGNFERIEIYGFEMASSGEFEHQKKNAEFWIGVANGMNKEIYLPPGSQLLMGPLYGYVGQGPSNIEGAL